jgi:hypothetical protein
MGYYTSSRKSLSAKFNLLSEKKIAAQQTRDVRKIKLSFINPDLSALYSKHFGLLMDRTLPYPPINAHTPYGETCAKLVGFKEQKIYFSFLKPAIFDTVTTLRLGML